MYIGTSISDSTPARSNRLEISVSSDWTSGKPGTCCKLFKAQSQQAGRAALALAQSLRAFCNGLVDPKRARLAGSPSKPVRAQEGCRYFLYRRVRVCTSIRYLDCTSSSDLQAAPTSDSLLGIQITRQSGETIRTTPKTIRTTPEFILHSPL